MSSHRQRSVAARLLGALLVFVAVALAAVPVSAGVITPPPPVIAPPTVTPVAPPEGTGDLGDYYDSLCNGATAWLLDDLGYCSGTTPEVPGEQAPPTVAIIPEPFSGDGAIDVVFSNLETWQDALDSWTLVQPGVVEAAGQSSGVTFGPGPVIDEQIAVVVEVPDQGGTNAPILTYSGTTPGSAQYWLVNETHLAQCEAQNCSSIAHGMQAGDSFGLVITQTNHDIVNTRRPSDGAHWYTRTFWPGITASNATVYWGSLPGDPRTARAPITTRIGWAYHRHVPPNTSTPFELLAVAGQGSLTEVEVGGDGWVDGWPDFISDFLADVEDAKQRAPQVAPTWTYDNGGLQFPVIELDPSEETGTDTGLARRIGSFFSALSDNILGGLGQVVDAIWGGFTWAIDAMWPMFEWLAGVLSPLIEGVIAAVRQVRDAVIQFSQSVWSQLQTVISWLGGLWALLSSIFSAIVSGFAAVVAGIGNLVVQIPQLLLNIIGWVAQIPALIASLPGLFLDAIVGVCVWLFAPPGDLMPPPEDLPPVVQVITEIPPAVGDIYGMIDLGANCGPQLNVDLPDTISGDSGSLQWHAPNPSSSGCPGNGPNGAWTNADTQIGNLFGYRTAFRAALSILLVIGFGFRLVAMFSPWWRSEEESVGDNDAFTMGAVYSGVGR